MGREAAYVALTRHTEEAKLYASTDLLYKKNESMNQEIVTEIQEKLNLNLMTQGIEKEKNILEFISRMNPIEPKVESLKLEPETMIVKDQLDLENKGIHRDLDGKDNRNHERESKRNSEAERESKREPLRESVKEPMRGTGNEIGTESRRLLERKPERDAEKERQYRRVSDNQKESQKDIRKDIQRDNRKEEIINQKLDGIRNEIEESKKAREEKDLKNKTIREEQLKTLVTSRHMDYLKDLLKHSGYKEEVDRPSSKLSLHERQRVTENLYKIASEPAPVEKIFQRVNPNEKTDYQLKAQSILKSHDYSDQHLKELKALMEQKRIGKEPVLTLLEKGQFQKSYSEIEEDRNKAIIYDKESRLSYVTSKQKELLEKLFEVSESIEVKNKRDKDRYQEKNKETNRDHENIRDKEKIRVEIEEVRFNFDILEKRNQILKELALSNAAVSPKLNFEKTEIQEEALKIIKKPVNTENIRETMKNTNGWAFSVLHGFNESKEGREPRKEWVQAVEKESSSLEKFVGVFREKTVQHLQDKYENVLKMEMKKEKERGVKREIQGATIERNSDKEVEKEKEKEIKLSKDRSRGMSIGW